MLNEITLIGNAGHDVELRFTSTGRQVANFSVAVNERWTDNEGQQQERTTWVRIVCWMARAEFASKYVTKGKRMLIRGKLTGAEGWYKDDAINAIPVVKAEMIQFLDPKPEEEK